MRIKILCPLWGHEHLEIKTFINKVKEAGYDGIDSWIPEDAVARKQLLDGLQKEELTFVSQQHQAHGKDFEAYKTSFREYLAFSAQGAPLMINSHTGKDYFTFQQNLELIDIAAEFGAKTGIPVVHETHRGRVGYAPGHLQEFMAVRPEMTVTADFSHWVCVTESLLENFSGILDQAISQTRHAHTRVGFEEGPQVPDPRAPEWDYVLQLFLQWWDRMVSRREAAGDPLFTFTTEFGPPPYLPILPFSRKPVADQFEINVYMKDLLRRRYAAYL